MRLFIVIPTYLRNDDLAALLQAIVAQTIHPYAVIVVDNGSSSTCMEVVNSAAALCPDIHFKYVDPGVNTGSAGGTAIGMRLAVELADYQDWIMRCDDDLVPTSDDLLEVNCKEAQRCRALDARTAGLGRHGARYDAATFQLTKPSHDSTTKYVPVDYLATNHYPLFSVAAVTEVGVFREDLFFGFSEVEYGLRLRRAGYRLYRLDLPDQWRHPSSSPRKRLGPVTWRRYYSLRNHIVVVRELYGLGPAIRLSLQVGILKPLYNMISAPRLGAQHLVLGMRAILDAFCGRLGEQVKPTVHEGKLALRSDEENRHL